MDTDFYRTLVHQLLPRIRKPRSQGQLGLRLRVETKRISDWEVGRKSISWRDFARLYEACGISLESILRDHSSLPKKTSLKDAQSVFRHFTGKGTYVEISARLEISRDRVGRLLRGEATPTTIEILRAIHCTGPAFFSIVHALSRSEDPPIIADRMRRHRAQSELYAEAPWTSLIANALALPEYRAYPHSDPWLAARTRISLPHLRKLLTRMSDAGLIEFVQGSYRLLPLESFAPTGNPEAEKRGTLYWSALARSAVSQGYRKPHCRASWSVFNLSEAGHDELLEAVNQFRRTMSAIIDSDERKDTADKRTYLYSLNLVDANYVPEGAADSTSEK